MRLLPRRFFENGQTKKSYATFLYVVVSTCSIEKERSDLLAMMIGWICSLAGLLLLHLCAFAKGTAAAIGA